jgi:monoamine oxidase
MVENFSRRDFLRRGAAVGAAVAVAPSGLAFARGAETVAGPRIVIVGAGLAGLSCAYRLQRAGLGCSVFEANPHRVGGRCWTARQFKYGQTAEHGGEFIDTRHRRIRALAQGFGLELKDLYGEPIGGRGRRWLDGELRAAPLHRHDWRTFQREIYRTARRIGRWDYRNPTRAARALDEMTAAEWVEEHVPGGMGGVAGGLIGVWLSGDLGLDPDRLSAIGLIAEWVVPAPGADERYSIRGGNDQLVTRLAGSLPDGTVRMDAPLQRLSKRSDGTYEMRFGGVAKTVRADHLVLALPFTTLREVDLSGAGFSRKRLECIQRLGMGTNAKVLMQLEEPPQRYGRWNGDMVGDDPYLFTWDSTLRQRGRGSIITTFLGGRSGAGGLPATRAHGPSPRAVTQSTFRDVSRGGATRIPGLRAGFNGSTWTDKWVLDPWVKGSYAAFLPGQYTRYYGYAGRSEGRVRFAGEHTQTDAQGYLEGAVRSGEKAAMSIVAET